MATKFPQPTHFFKIIKDQSLQEGKLMIPRGFVNKFGEALPRTVFLKPPHGREWKLTLVKSNGNMWFEEGWKEFAQHHSLAHGHLLVFKCQRSSYFQVQIFDMSAVETNFHFRREKSKRASSCHGSSEVQRAGKKCKGKKMNTAKEATALDRAKSFKPCNPYFLVSMHPSYIHKSNQYHLCIPAMFGKTHLDFGHNRRMDVQLRVLNGRSWPARCTIRKSQENGRFELSGGWKAFSEDNNLNVGDVCIFELIDKIKLTFMVYIFKESENAGCSTSSR